MRGAKLLGQWTQGTEGWYASMALANLALGTSSTLVPLLIAHVLGGSVAEVGLQSSGVSLVGVVGSLVWGRLADAAPQRKPFLFLSFSLLAVTFAGIAFTRSFWALVAYGMVQNFFWVATGAVSVLLLTERQGKASWERRIGQLNQIGALGWLAGLALGSVALAVGTRLTTEETAMRGLFLILALTSAAATLLAARLVPCADASLAGRPFRGAALALKALLTEASKLTPHHLARCLDPRRLPALLSTKDAHDRATRLFLAETFLAFAGIGFFGIPLPLLLAERFSIPSSEVFLYFVVLNVGVVAAYPLASHRIGRMGNKAVQGGALLARLGLFALAAAFLFLSPSPPPGIAIALHLLALGVSWSFFQLSGVALASRLARPERRGRVLGLYNATASAGWIVAGVGSGYLAREAGYPASFAAAAALIALSLLVLRAVPSPGSADAGGSSAPSPERG